MSARIGSDLGRIGLGLVALLVGFAAIMSLSTVPATSAVPALLALVGVALLVVGTLVIGTSDPGRNA